MKEVRIRLLARGIEALATDEKIEMWNTYLRDYILDYSDIIYDMNDIEDILHGLTLKQILWAIEGNDFKTDEDYFCYDSMGDLYSSSEKNLDNIWDFEEMIIEIERIEGIIFGNVEGVKLFLENLE